jgi:hypothetical protein
MNNIEELQNTVSMMEERMDNKLKVLFKYKTVQLSLKIITFTAIACLLFVRSSYHHDIILWFIGIYMTLVALSELFELEEIRVYLKDSKKVSSKSKDNVY